MSSHHIIREAQEPALFIWQAEELAQEELAQLLEWSPTLITREESLDAVLEQGIKVDAVVCTPEKEAEINKRAAAQSHIQFIPAASTEEVLSAALLHLQQQGQQAINLLASAPTAEAYLLPALAAQRLLPNVVVLTGREKWALYRNGSFTKWLPAQEEVRIQGAQAGLCFRSGGFIHDLQEAVPDTQQKLRTAVSGTKSIQANGPFWVAEQLS